MSSGERIRLARARVYAGEIISVLDDCCETITVAGSIRREKANVGDVEIVCVPKLQPAGDLFGESSGHVDLLAERVQALITGGVFSPRLDANGRRAMGAKYLRLLYRGFPLDLFVTTRSQLGLILAIRTGPAEFSHRLVTHRHKGGLLPLSIQVHGGVLWRGASPVPTPTEQALFDAIGLPWVEPKDRTGRERAGVLAAQY